MAAWLFSGGCGKNLVVQLGMEPNHSNYVID
jgi:hypothetical protein